MGIYDDIIGLPRPQSTRPKMSRYDRSAQFAPFAALTGYEGILAETARLTDRKIEFDEDVRAAVDMRLRRLCDRIKERPAATVLCFRADERKEGGRYVTVSGRVKRVNVNDGILQMESGERVAFSDIAWIETDETEKNEAVE